MTRVLVDTSVWIEHFRRSNDELAGLLVQDRVVIHPFVVGELACGTPPDRTQTLASLQLLMPAKQASVQEVLLLLEQESLFGQGLGLVDMSLLASTRLMPGTRLWTLDKRLHAAAQRLQVGYQAGTGPNAIAQRLG